MFSALFLRLGVRVGGKGREQNARSCIPSPVICLNSIKNYEMAEHLLYFYVKNIQTIEVRNYNKKEREREAPVVPSSEYKNYGNDTLAQTRNRLQVSGTEFCLEI